MSSASAQGTIVSPAVWASAPGNDYLYHPLGTSRNSSPAMRFLALHDDMMGKPAVLKGLALRPEERFATVATTVTMEVRVSTAAAPFAAASMTFDSNHGADKRTVVPASTPFSYPAYPAFTALPPKPAPFVFTVPFATPFVFLGGGGIAWEMLISSRSNVSAFQLDAARLPFEEIGAIIGIGCFSSGVGVRPTAFVKVSAATGTVTLGSGYLRPLAAGTVVLGASAVQWGALTLPWDIPGTASSYSGVCRINNDWIVDFPQLTTALGELNVTFPLALGPGSLGLQTYHYGLILDATANAAGVVTTQGRWTMFGDGSLVPGGSLVHQSDVNAPVASEKSYLPITMFQN